MQPTIRDLSPVVINLTVKEGKRLPYYEGEYVVTPKIIEQVLKTKDKSMSDDVTVKEIPYHEVSNPKGLTVTIGGIL